MTAATRNATIDVQTALQSWFDAGVFEPLDVQLATMFVRRNAEPESRALVMALVTAFTSRACRDGNSAITVAQLSAQFSHARASADVELPDGGANSDDEFWVSAMRASSLVGDGSAHVPLVLRDDVVQFKRYHDAELRIARRVLSLANEPAAAGVPAFSIITGGPGTGKTTEVVRKLLDLRALAPDMRIALAAPTGKAAARLTESIRQRLGTLAASGSDTVSAPEEARTLHRLLGYSADRNIFRRNAADPLEHDLVIVDEASMVDVLMLDALLRALKPGARLMLVGDHHQLASVDAGDVLGALTRAALSATEGTQLRNCVTVLDRSFRFGDSSGIGALAKAILDGDADAVMRVARNATLSDVQLRSDGRSTDMVLESITPSLERCLMSESAGALLEALDSFRILAPEREGRSGVRAINTAVERWLSRHGHAVSDVWYHGRPVLVTANDYAIGVFNGDVGVVWRDGDQALVYFRRVDGTLRGVAPARLPAVETAWAMTVHKSQGSEFDDVVVVVPEHDSRTMSRELLYTAVTRARRSVTIVGEAEAVRRAVVRSSGRTSGLAERLGG